MKKIKIEDIERNEPFKAPEGYFEMLPHRIQQEAIDRTLSLSVATKWSFKISTALSYTMPVLVILLFVVFWFLRPANSTETLTTEQLLSEISHEEITQYLASSNLSAFEIAEEAALTQQDVDNILLGEMKYIEDLEKEEIEESLNMLNSEDPTLQ